MTNLKLAFRTLFKTPFVTVVAVLSLALGIGANAAIFSLFDQMLLRPVPTVRDPLRLVNLSAPGPKPGSQSCNQAGDCEAVFSYPMFRDLEKAQTPFTGIAAHLSFGANLSARGTITEAVAGTGAVIASLTSVAINLPLVLSGQNKRLTQRLMLATGVIAGVGVVGLLAQGTVLRLLGLLGLAG